MVTMNENGGRKELCEKILHEDERDPVSLRKLASSRGTLPARTSPLTRHSSLPRNAQARVQVASPLQDIRPASCGERIRMLVVRFSRLRDQ
jgi:hypothetical protein